MTGPASIGPGDVQGNLQVGPNSHIDFNSPSGAAQTFNAGATLGLGAGTVEFDGPVAMNANLIDQSSQLSLVPGGSITGSGSIDTHEPFEWSGGTLAPAGGVILEGNSDFHTSGLANTVETLGTKLTNYSLTTDFGGAAPLGLAGPSGGAPGGSIVNDAGIIDVSIPVIGSAGAGGITNYATFTGQAPASSPTTISAPFTNHGTLSVDTGDALVLAPTSGTTDILDGTVQLDGDLTLVGSFLSDAGFSQNAGGGTLFIGSSTLGTGTLTVASGQTALLNGTVEVTGSGLLTGGGELSNSGVLKLDLYSSTTGLGSYVQSSTGTLDLQASGPGFNSALTVTGVASLSGTLELDFVDGYTPKVGDSWVVVTAGTVEHHFDTVPNGTTPTYGTGAVTLTKTS